MNIDERAQRCVVAIEQLDNTVIIRGVTDQCRLSQIIMEAVKVKLAPTSTLTSNGGVVLRHQQVKPANDEGVVRKHRRIDNNRSNAQFATCNNDVKRATFLVCRASNMLN
jgi:hypothetical protein